MQYKPGDIAEYRNIDNAPRAERSPVMVGRLRGDGARVELARVSEGFECAGSCARYTEAYWSVRWHDGSAYHGRRFRDGVDAQDYFKRVTAKPAA